MSDAEIVDEGPAPDAGASLATALIVLTTIVMIAAVVVINGVASSQYQGNSFF